VIKNWIITGDTHGQNETRLKNIKSNSPECNPTETAIIILGDVGFQYYKNKKDWKNKHYAAKMGYALYCLRGNHEDRISNSKEAHRIYDEEVKGYVWVEDEFPNIKYFEDCVSEYTIDGKSVLVIPGAYSVDKWYRLQNNWMWFAQEQLTADEMKSAEIMVSGKHYDMVLSHTTPIDWEPNDLFLRGIDQSKVDKTMEVWLSQLKEMFGWDLWLFGHYHADRIERPYVEQFYLEYENLNDIWARWTKYHKFKELDWWLPKSPNFYMEVSK
jgi:3-oxoacid CoA-transferase subunit A